MENKTKTSSYNLEIGLIDKIKKISDDSLINRSKLVNQILKMVLSNIESSDDFNKFINDYKLFIDIQK